MAKKTKVLSLPAIESLVKRIVTTKNDVARFRFVQELVRGGDETRLRAVDGVFRRDKARLRAYPEVLAAFIDAGVPGVTSILDELVRDKDEVIGANALEVVWAKRLADDLLDSVLPFALAGKFGIRRHAAVKALTGARSERAMVELIKLSRPGVLPGPQRVLVYRGLSESDAPEAADALRRAFDDFAEHPLVRTYAAYGIARRGDARGLQALKSNLELLEAPTVSQVVVQSTVALHKLVGVPSAVGSAVIPAARTARDKLEKDWDAVLKSFARNHRSRAGA